MMLIEVLGNNLICQTDLHVAKTQKRRTVEINKNIFATHLYVAFVPL